MVDRYDTNRTYFSNHAFLVWTLGPTRPQLYNDSEDKIPPLSENSEIFAIDACAGPHTGNEPRGVWEQPWNITRGKGVTYSGMRDTAHDEKFDEKYWNEHHGPDILPPKDAEILNHHGCTIGIARLVTDKAGPSIYLPGQDPFDKT